MKTAFVILIIISSLNCFAHECWTDTTFDYANPIVVGRGSTWLNKSQISQQSRVSLEKVLLDSFPFPCDSFKSSIIKVQYCFSKLNQVVVLYSNSYSTVVYIYNYLNHKLKCVYKTRKNSFELESHFQIVNQNATYLFVTYVVGMQKVDNLVIYSIEGDSLNEISPKHPDYNNQFSLFTEGSINISVKDKNKISITIDYPKCLDNGECGKIYEFNIKTKQFSLIEIRKKSKK